MRDGRAARGADGTYTSREYLIPLESPSGWEAAVFDHYQAVVTAITTKLRRGSRRASRDDHTGGSTYIFELWPGHPHAEEALAFLRMTREIGVSLRQKIQAHNTSVGSIPSSAYRLLAYVGQAMLDADEDGEDT